MAIEWEKETVEPNSNGLFDNQGTDGDGLIAGFKYLGTQEKIVNLSFFFYVEGENTPEDLPKLCEEIATVIHKHLD